MEYRVDYREDIDVCIVRDPSDTGTGRLGCLEIARQREDQFWRTVLDEPAGWDDHGAAEAR